MINSFVLFVEVSFLRLSEIKKPVTKNICLKRAFSYFAKMKKLQKKLLHFI